MLNRGEYSTGLLAEALSPVLRYGGESVGGSGLVSHLAAISSADGRDPASEP